MSGESIRAWALSGPGAEAALDWLHVHAAVRGVHEADGELTVYLVGEPPPLPLPSVTMREVAVDDRPITGLEHDRVIVVAGDLIVRPPWVPAPVGFAGVELVVPRGGAFGSGEHASTQAALEALHALWNSPASCADVGTGSGILALYAAVRGCADLQACDIDPAAVAAASALLPSARVALGGPGVLGAADCVIANMTGAELHGALPAIVALWGGAGPLVLGGMRAAEVDRIRGLLPGTPARVARCGAFTALGYAGGRVR